MSHHGVPLENRPDVLELFAKDMQVVWSARGGEIIIEEMVNGNQEKLKTGKLKGIVLFEGETPKGVAWVERMLPNYGSMLLHDLDPSIRLELAKALVDSGLLENCLAELFIFHDTPDYIEAFTKLGLTANHRQRMAYRLDEHPITQPDIPIGLYLEPYTEKDIDEAAELCARAHQVSKDYRGFYELERPERRIALEKGSRSNEYGLFIQQASWILRYQGDLVGAITMIELENWGYKHLPWVFDVCVDPKYHGRGFGKVLMQKAMAELCELHYPVMGLAVTLDNPALALYENLGFFAVEPFCEFAWHVL